eukprot:m.287562 g.287562  ORF g.287562 m.287562 type:complete len:1005 (+) comp15790_c5_seq3:204-3218(+)
MRWLVCAVVVLLGCCMSASSVSAAKAPTNDLKKWLYSLEISLPNITITSSINLTETKCVHLDVGTVSSAVKPQTIEYDLKLQGMSAECTGALVYTLLGKSYEIDFDLQIVSDKAATSSIAVGIQLTKGSDGLAHKATAANLMVNLHATIGFEHAPNWLNAILAIVEQALMPSLDKTVESMLTDLINTNLTQTLEAINKDLAPFIHPNPPVPPPPVPPGSANLSESGLVDLLSFFTGELFANNTLNFVVDLLTNKTGQINDNSLNVSITVPLGELGSLELGLLSLQLAGLDSWDNSTHLIKGHDYNLETFTDLQSLMINLTLFVMVKTPLSPITLYEEAVVTFRIDNATLNMTTQVAINNTQLDAFTTHQLFNVSCLLSAISSVNMTNLNLNFTLEQLEITAPSGSTEQDLDTAVDDLLKLLFSSYELVAPAFLDALVAEPLRVDFNKFISKTIANATCLANSTAASTSNLGTPFRIAAGGTSLIFVLVVVFLCCLGRAKGDLPSRESISETSALVQSHYSSPSACLALEHSVPAFARYLVPLVILGTIAMLVFSNTSAGADVFPVITLNNNSYEFAPLFTFDLANSIKDMWKGHVRPLSVLIAAFSGAWPYAKLLLMLFAWVAPLNWLKVAKRETLLRFLDALGKWSLIDSYVLTMMMVAFRFHLPFNAPEGDDTTAAFDIFVQGQIGFATFVIATVISLVLTHLLLFFHRRAQKAQHDPITSNDKQRLFDHEFVSKHHSNFRFTRCGSILVSALLIATIAFMIGGAFATAFTFKFEGLAALALIDDGQSANRSYSLITMGQTIPDSGPNPKSFNVLYIQILFFIFALVIPVIHMICLLFLKHVRLTFKAQQRFFVACEVFNAWSGLDVFMVSLIAAVAEISRFAQFIIGDDCNGINKIIEPYANLWPKLNGSGTCFSVETTINYGTWILTPATIAMWCVGYAVMQLCHRAIEDRLQAETSARHLSTINAHVIGTDGPKKGCGSRLFRMATFLHIIRPADEYFT